MKYFQVLALLTVLVLAACEPEAAAKAFEQAKQAGNDYLLQPIQEGYQKSIETSQRANEVHQSVTEVHDSIKEAEDKVVAVKSAVKEKTVAVKKSARRWARRAPRSREEANRMVQARGKGYFEWLRSRVAAFTEKHSLDKVKQKRARSIKK